MPDQTLSWIGEKGKIGWMADNTRIKQFFSARCLPWRVCDRQPHTITQNQLPISGEQSVDVCDLA